MEFSKFGQNKGTTGTPVLDLFAWFGGSPQAVGANRKVRIKGVSITFEDVPGAGSWGVIRLGAYRPDGSPIVEWFTALFSTVSPETFSARDLGIEFDSGPEGCTIEATVESLNAACSANITISGQYR